MHVTLDRNVYWNTLCERPYVWPTLPFISSTLPLAYPHILSFSHLVSHSLILHSAYNISMALLAREGTKHMAYLSICTPHPSLALQVPLKITYLEIEVTHSASKDRNGDLDSSRVGRIFCKLIETDVYKILSTVPDPCYALNRSCYLMTGLVSRLMEI